MFLSNNLLKYELVNKYTAQQKFSMDFIFVLILVRIRNDFFEGINKYGNPYIYDFLCLLNKR